MRLPRRRESDRHFEKRSKPVTREGSRHSPLTVLAATPHPPPGDLGNRGCDQTAAKRTLRKSWKRAGHHRERAALSASSIPGEIEWLFFGEEPSSAAKKGVFCMQEWRNAQSSSVQTSRNPEWALE